MKTPAGYDQCFNAQLAVDESSQLIVGVELTNSASDSGQLLPLLEKIEAEQKARPQQVIADAGYRAEKTFVELEKREVQAFISVSRKGERATNPAHEATQRMRELLKTEAGAKRYSRRKAIVEPVIGWIKQILGFRRFSLRGQSKAQGEWNLVCLAVNLKRLKTLKAAT